jgi:hypothetical protein
MNHIFESSAGRLAFQPGVRLRQAPVFVTLCMTQKQRRIQGRFRP